ncbi:MAG: HAD family hydrolase [Promethearchaeota archaeon]
MHVKAILFDFGFTLFYFESPSIKEYLKCFSKGLKKATLFLKTSKILITESINEKFLKEFQKRRAILFRKSLKTRDEYPSSYLFEIVLEKLVKRGLVEPFEEKDKDFYQKLADYYHSCELEQWIPFNHTKETLEQLRKIPDLKLAVLSNHPNHNTIIALLEKYDLIKYFDIIVTSAGFGKRKPNPEIFYYTLKQLELQDNAHECFICGDEHADIAGGYRAGLQTILCERIFKFPFEKEINIPDLIRIKDISEIIELIQIEK